MDLKDIKAIIDLMKKNSISEFELEQQDFKIRLKRGANGGAHPGGGEEGLLTYPGQHLAGALPAPVSLPPPAATSDLEIKSPMVGTFYRAPSPESANYARSAPK